MILYKEIDLDKSWREDCKIRSKLDECWIRREQYRNMFENAIDMYLATGAKTKLIHIPEWIYESINKEIT